MKKAIWFLVAIFLANIVGLYFKWYLKYSWFDQILHFSGGFFVAMLFSVHLKDNLHQNTKLKNTLIIVGVTALVGVLWEFSEFIASLYLSPYFYHVYGIRTYFIGDLADTLNDLLMDILGAGVFSFILHFLRSRKLQLHPFGSSETHKI